MLYLMNRIQKVRKAVVFGLRVLKSFNIKLIGLPFTSNPQFEFDWLIEFFFFAVVDFAKKSIMMDNFYLNDNNSLIGDKMDKKLINLCRAHDEICDIAKQVNRLFSLQMLITMAYGFLAITAQFYFLYCGLMNQVWNNDKNSVVIAY